VPRSIRQRPLVKRLNEKMATISKVVFRACWLATTSHSLVSPSQVDSIFSSSDLSNVAQLVSWLDPSRQAGRRASNATVISPRFTTQFIPSAPAFHAEHGIVMLMGSLDIRPLHAMDTIHPGWQQLCKPDSMKMGRFATLCSGREPPTAADSKMLEGVTTFAPTTAKASFPFLNCRGFTLGVARQLISHSTTCTERFWWQGSEAIGKSPVRRSARRFNRCFRLAQLQQHRLCLYGPGCSAASAGSAVVLVFLVSGILVFIWCLSPIREYVTPGDHPMTVPTGDLGRLAFLAMRSIDLTSMPRLAWSP